VFLNRALESIARGKTGNAIRFIDHALERADGYVLRGAIDLKGSGADWITDPTVQVSFYDLLVAARDALD
jgi:hypothetical protein